MTGTIRESDSFPSHVRHDPERSGHTRYVRQPRYYISQSPTVESRDIRSHLCDQPQICGPASNVDREGFTVSHSRRATPSHSTGQGSPLPPLSSILSSRELTAAQSLGVHTISDLLRIPPRRYVEPGPLRAMNELTEGEDVSAVVTVVDIRERRMKRRPGFLLDVTVSDGHDSLSLPFFLPRQHLLSWHKSRLVPGRSIIIFGTVSLRREGGSLRPQVTHPRYEVLDGEEIDRDTLLAPLPVYPLRRGITQTHMRAAYQKALAHADSIPQVIPSSLQKECEVGALGDSLRALHKPRTMSDVARGVRHLALEEAFVLQAIFAERRARDKSQPAPALTTAGPLTAGLTERLPFTLTDGQTEVISTILTSIEQPHPTTTLLQGDVGSGKTAVALHAMVRAVDSGHQAVLLAPTDVLARQHHATITRILGDMACAGQLHGHADATTVRLLTGSLTTAERQRALLDITTGEAGIVVGTHAVLEERVDFFSLGLAVIDEQHRFGVDQRRRLRAKGPTGSNPHTIVMTATPIPRTAALALGGDLDIVSLTEVPARRAGMSSHAVPEQIPAWESRMWSRVAEECAAGRQAFVVCPRIDASDEAPAGFSEHEAATTTSGSALEPRSVADMVVALGRRAETANLRLGVVHGRMSAEEKTAVMDRMAAGEIDILIATTVIEVGIDIPNASAIVVLDAERFGVSQLHQLRGRVGRGEHPGIAFFASRAEPTSDTLRRLTDIASTIDGFRLAELDLEIRGSGDLVGDTQSGIGPTLHHLDILRDHELVATARAHAAALAESDPTFDRCDALRQAMNKRLADADPDVERS